MRWLLDLLSTSIGKKVLMALTGLFLVLFLAVHLYGNLYLYVGEEAFNHHAEAISGSALIRIVEVVLFLAIVAHAVSGVQLTIRNPARAPAALPREATCRLQHAGLSQHDRIRQRGVHLHRRAPAQLLL